MTEACLQCGRLLVGVVGHPDSYCCGGCEQASQMERQLKLVTPSSRFAFLDEPSFLKSHPELEFYIEGVTCPSCVQALEGITRADDSIEAARMDLGRSVLRVALGQGGSYVRVVEAIEALGYRASPLTESNHRHDLQKKEARSELIRIGIAAACSMNIMLSSVSLYGGAPGGFASLFRWLTLGLAVPSVFYCAWPFYQSTLAALKSGRISIDLPVSAAILIGFFSGLYRAITGSNEIYLDSLTALIFLLLSSRYFLKRLQQRTLDLDDVMSSWLPDSTAQVGQSWSVRSTDLIPVDGILLDDSAWVDTSVVTGESLPREFTKGQLVQAGMVNLGPEMRLQVTAVGADRAVAKQLSGLDRFQLDKNKTIQIADWYAQIFLGIILLVAMSVVAYFWKTNLTVGLYRALTLAVVACPCALALATPLTFVQGYRAALKQGIILKNVSVFDRILGLEQIYFDKTGTLTWGRLEVVSLVEYFPRKPWKTAAVLLERPSKHPVARAVTRTLSTSCVEQNVQQWKETPGVGVSGYWNGQHWEVKRAPQSAELGVYADGVLIASMVLQDVLRDETPTVISRLRKLGFKVGLLSGDHEQPAKTIGAKAGFLRSEIDFELKPEQKAKIAKGSVMVGDGLNDAPALAQSALGIAVRGALETNLRVADAVCTRDGIGGVADLCTLARQVRSTLLMNYGFSALYNAIGAGLAVMGWIGPLGAAVLMPLSSLTVFLTTFRIGKRLEQS